MGMVLSCIMLGIDFHHTDCYDSRLVHGYQKFMATKFMVTGMLNATFYVKTASILFHLRPINSLYIILSMNSKENLVTNLEVDG